MPGFESVRSLMNQSVALEHTSTRDRKNIIARNCSAEQVQRYELGTRTVVSIHRRLVSAPDRDHRYHWPGEEAVE
jgi:hypothetical protein